MFGNAYYLIDAYNAFVELLFMEK